MLANIFDGQDPGFIFHPFPATHKPYVEAGID